MAKNSNAFKAKLYDLLKVRGYDPVPLDNKGNRVPVSQDSDVIQFMFTKDGKEYGKCWVSIDDKHRLTLYYDNEQEDSPNDVTPGVQYDDTWTGLLENLKHWAMRRQLDFKLANKDRLADDMKQREYYRMKEKLGEGYYPMGKKASYNDGVPNVKIILQHTRQIEEGEQRFRNIARIFVENTEGERFLVPTNRPGIARVYARHISEGGVPNDDRWNHIKGLCEEYTKMAGFARATRGAIFSESAQPIVIAGIAHYNMLRENLSKMTGHRGYNAYFDAWTPTLMENENSEDISEMFMNSSLDPRIESVMPILSRLRKSISEVKEISDLEQWASDVIRETTDVKNKADQDHTEEENDMAKDNLHKMATASSKLEKNVKKMGDKKSLEPWQQQLIATAADKVDAVYHSKDDDEIDEDLGPEQKRVGQLGPTEPVGKNEKNLRGKLVGANESVEYDELADLKRLLGK